MRRDECESFVPGSFLSLVSQESGYLYVIGPTKIMRFRPEADSKDDYNYAGSFSWDFGEPLLTDGFFKAWQEQRSLG